MFRKRVREAASLGASGLADRVLFESWGVPVFGSIFGTLFFTQKCTFGLKYGRNLAPKLTLALTLEAIFTFFENP